MSHAFDETAFYRATEPLFRLLTDDQMQRLVGLSPDRDLEVRIVELARRAEEDNLTTEERAEYESYVRANNLLAVLQGIARRRLAPHQARQ